jgi:acylphosphatase
MITRHLVIHGRVQGVFFRESMRQRARQLGVTGWVRNRFDGTVEAMVQAEDEAVAAIIEWARRGPDTANVTDLQIEDGDGNYVVFDTLPTL